MYAKLASNIHRIAFPGIKRRVNVVNSLLGRLRKLLVKTLQRKVALTLYTLGCDQAAIFEEFNVSRY
jgi:hypothetical protein